MSEKITTGIQRSRPSTLTLLVIAVSTLILASCGGGSDSTSSAESADGTKQALGVSGTAATVPGGWTGRAPKMEVINGITVPPEPAPSINNATLAGVDVNANGVRDDVEREIAKSSQSNANFVTSVEYARQLQSLLKNQTVPTSSTEAMHIYMRPICAIQGKQSEYVDIKYKPLIFNTPARKAKYREISNLIPALSGADYEAYTCP